MLESIYWILSITAFFCLLTSFFHKKRPARFILQSISVVLFSSLAMASTQVEKFQCENAIIMTNQTNSTYSGGNSTLIQYTNDIICEKNSTFDAASVWVFVGMTLISATISFLTAINTLSMRQED